CHDMFSGLALADDAKNPLAPKKPHIAPRAKRVIHVFANGGPSHLDTFDPKPALVKYKGKMLPNPNPATERKTGAAFPSPFKFEKRGHSGLEVSEIFAKPRPHADEPRVIRSMQADAPNHQPPLLLMNCGEERLSRPSTAAC